jgi:hypothetical protein
VKDEKGSSRRPQRTRSNQKNKISNRNCPDTQAREGAQIPPSHHSNFPVARWLARAACHAPQQRRPYASHLHIRT